MLGQKTTEQERRIFLNIKNGAIVTRTATGEESFSFVEGRVSNLFTKVRDFHGEKVTYWYIDLRDEESGELYSLASSYTSNTFKSIILSLASEQGLDAIRQGAKVKIEPYTKNGYDKVTTSANGSRLDWAIATLPPIEQVSVGGRIVKDDSKRMELITQLYEKVKSNIVTK